MNDNAESIASRCVRGRQDSLRAQDLPQNTRRDPSMSRHEMGWQSFTCERAAAESSRRAKCWRVRLVVGRQPYRARNTLRRERGGPLQPFRVRVGRAAWPVACRWTHASGGSPYRRSLVAHLQAKLPQRYQDHCTRLAQFELPVQCSTLCPHQARRLAACGPSASGAVVGELKWKTDLAGPHQPMWCWNVEQRSIYLNPSKASLFFLPLSPRSPCVSVAHAPADVEILSDNRLVAADQPIPRMNSTMTEHDYRFPRRPDGRQLGDHDRRTLDISLLQVGADVRRNAASASRTLLNTPLFPGLERTSVDERTSADQMKQEDPIGMQMWKYFARMKQQLPNHDRMENLSWRMMSVALQKQGAAKPHHNRYERSRA